MHVACTRARRRGGRVQDRIGLFLVGELDIDECCQGLDGAAMLGMVEEVSMTRLELGIPVEDIEVLTCLRTFLALLLSLWRLTIASKGSLWLEIEGLREALRVESHTWTSRWY